MRRLAPLLFALALPPVCGNAQAQVPAIEQGIGFSLKPRATPIRLSPASAAIGRTDSFAAGPGRVAADDHAHDMRIAAQRQTRRFVAGAVGAPDGAGTALVVQPRSRVTRLLVEDHLPIGDHVTAMLGWQGVRLSNRNANVTVGAGDDRLRARDWFLPRAALRIDATPTLGLAVDYAETLLGYADTGLAGPLGLTREAFRTLRDNLRPETRSRVRLTADWTPDQSFGLTAHAYGGRLDDRLSFLDRGYLPVNGGSARIEGGSLTARHRLSPHLRWSLRYDAARVRVSGGIMRSERNLAVEGAWTDGPWRATVRAARNSAPALAAGRQRPLRVEAGLDYAAASLCLCPLRLAARLTDPDRLASSALGGDQPAGVVRAADQARALMLSAALDW